MAVFLSLLIVYKSIIAGTVGVGVIVIIINYIQNVFNPVINMWKKLKLDSLLDNIERSSSAGVSGDSISGGERKRVALMRGVNQYADIYLFDEPTSELDDESRQCVANMIKELKQNFIVIVSTHDNALTEISDQVIYISNTKAQ